jgi:hypothetical protein
MRIRTAQWVLIYSIGFCSLLVVPRHAAADAGKDAQNPLASLISVPIENDYNYGLGSFDRTQPLLIFKPVIPFDLGGGWNLVTRTIVPTFVPQPITTTPNKSVYGLGDINPSFFFVAPPISNLTFGAGPQFIMPTATKTATGEGKWSAGPTAVVVWTPGNIVTGALINHVWSFADTSGGSRNPDVSRLGVQPFINYNFKKHPGWFFYSNPVITANWKASSGNQWTVPLGGGLGKTFKVGEQALQAKVGAFYNVIRPSSGADWQVQFNLNFLFPK